MRLGADRAAALRDGALFAAAGVVPAILAVALGLRAVRNEEAAIRREAATETEAAAREAESRLRAEVDASADRLAALRADTVPADPAARVALIRSIAPPWAESLLLDERLEPPGVARRPLASSSAAPRRAASACRASASAWRRGDTPLDATFIGCDEARTETGRWLVPLTLLATLHERDDAAAADLLVAWLTAHAARLRGAEREATREEIRASRMPPPRVARALAALDRADSGGAASAARGDAAREALARGPDPTGLVRWSGGGSLGVVRVLPDGALGLVVDAAVLREALPSIGGDQGTALRVITAEPRPSSSPRAVAWLAPGLGLEATLRGDDDLDARTRRARWALWAVAGGSAAVAVLFAGVLFARLRVARRTSELRTSFAAAVSHELRTPIASIRMLAELLEDERGGDEEERRETATAIAREARRLGETVSRLLAWSRVREGRSAIVRQRAPLGDVVGDAVDVFEERHPGVAVERGLDRAPTLAVDAPLVQLAVMNLLENARRYAPDGGPYRVVAEPSADGARIEVHDRGPGVPAPLRSRIFEAFERGDDRLSRATEGTGIGLALVRAVARAHGGDAWVESGRERGAIFVVTLRDDRGAGAVRRGDRGEAS